MTDLFSESEVGSGGRGDKARTARRQEQKRLRQRRRNLLTFTVMIVALALLVGGAWVLVRPLLSDDGATTATEITDYPGPGSGEVEIVVSPGDSGSDIGTTLTEADVVASVGAFTAAYSANPDATAIQAGHYTLSEQMRASDAVAALLDPASRSDLRVTIPEGWRSTQIYARVAEVLEVPVEDVEAAAEDLDLPSEAGGDAEGWLFASTYSLAPDATATDVLQQMADQTTSILDDLDVAADNRERVLTEASIVEGEVFLPEDRGQVARVILNRLDGCTLAAEPILQMDSTVAYGLDKSPGSLTSADLQTDTPYNTYIHAGLPPTPINSPSREAIEAVVDPPDGNWCYFVTVDLESGETIFTDDYAEHQANRERYREWLAENSTDADDSSDG